MTPDKTNTQGHGRLAVLTMALATAQSRDEQKPIKLKPYPTFDLDFKFFPAQPSKFIPSKENQPWKRNRRK